MVAHRVAPLGMEGKEHSQEGYGLHCALPLSRSSRKLSLHGVVSFPLSVDPTRVIEHEAPPMSGTAVILSLTLQRLVTDLLWERWLLRSCMPKLAGTAPTPAPLGHSVVFVALA